MPPGEAPRIFQEIEQSAAYYTPSIYAGLLRFFHDITIEDDPLASQFISLSQPGFSTALSQSGPNPKLFAVGIIPPSAFVTGRLLDRSASVASFTDDVPAATTGAAPVQADPNASGGQTTGAETFADLQNNPQFWIDYVLMCQRIGVDPRELAKVIDKESGWNPNATGADRGRVIAKGLNQMLRNTALNTGGVSQSDWDNYEDFSGQEQLPYLESYLKKTGAKGKNAGQLYAKNAGGWPIRWPNPTKDRYGYMSSGLFNSTNLSDDDRQRIINRLGNGDPEKGAKNLKKMFAGYNANAAADTKTGDGDGVLDARDLALRVSGPLRSAVAALIDQAEAAIAAGATGSTPTDPVNGDADNGKWQKEGSKDALEADKQQEKLGGLPKDGLNSTEFGKALQAAQAIQILETQAALDAMKRTPPLRMLVNPKSFRISGTKIVNDGNWGRNGPVIEHWGEEQDKVSASGSVSGFFAVATFNANGPGLTRMARNFSQAWKNFQSLYLLYRNNAGLYLNDHISSASGQTGRSNLAMMGSIYIYYDNILYIGSFDSFSITEDDTRPFSAEYSFEFTVRAAFLLDRTDELFLTAGIGDPRERGRGKLVPTAPPLGQSPPIPFGGSPPPESNNLFGPNNTPAQGGEQLFDIGGG